MFYGVQNIRLSTSTLEKSRLILSLLAGYLFLLLEFWSLLKDFSFASIRYSTRILFESHPFPGRELIPIVPWFSFIPYLWWTTVFSIVLLTVMFLIFSEAHNILSS